MTTHCELKPPTTYDQQIELLKSRGIVINNSLFARMVLERINYYRLSAYCLPFKKMDECFEFGITFEKVYKIYEFDRKLRNLIYYSIGPIEISLRTKIAYHHAHKYGAEGYKNKNNFQNQYHHQKFNEEFENAITQNANSLFIKHHLSKYEGKFPIWAAVEIFSLGMLSRFYANLLPGDRKTIANDYKISEQHLISWLKSITILRNICAHYSRVYYNKLSSTPKLLKEGEIKVSSFMVFDIIYVMKYIYPDPEAWNTEIITSFSSLVEQYSEEINLEHIGFPPNWESLLSIDGR